MKQSKNPEVKTILLAKNLYVTYLLVCKSALRCHSVKWCSTNVFFNLKENSKMFCKTHIKLAEEMNVSVVLHKKGQRIGSKQIQGR